MDLGSSVLNHHLIIRIEYHKRNNNFPKFRNIVNII